MIYFESLWNVVLHLTLQIFKNINVFHWFHQQAGGDLKGELGVGMIRVHEVVTHPAVSFQKEVDAFLDVVLELIDASIKEFAEASGVTVGATYGNSIFFSDPSHEYYTDFFIRKLN